MKYRHLVKNKKSGAALLLLLCLFCLTRSVVALDPGKSFSLYKQTVWNTENGLPTNVVLTMVQTRDGYLWFGTQEGLVRFNGVSFKTFDTVTAPLIKSNLVNALLEDRAGRLWVGTNKGLSIYQNGEFVALPADEGLSKNYISALYEDRSGDLWIGVSGGLNRLRGGSVTTYGAGEGLTGERIRCFGEDANGDLWVGTGTGLFQRRDDRFKAFTTSDGLTDNSIRRIYLDADHALRIGTDQGLSQLVGERFANDGRFSGKAVRTILRDRENSLWIGGDFGLSRINGDRMATLEGGGYAVLADTEGSVWFSTEGAGVRQLTDGKFTTYTTSENLSGDTVFSLAQNRAGDVWVSTDKGLSRFHADAFDLNLLKQKDLPNDRIVSILSDGGGAAGEDLWIGTTNGLLRRQNDKLVNVRGGENLLKKTVQALYRDAENNLWIGTNAGVYRFDEQSNGGEIVDYKRFEPLANAGVYTIAGSLSKGLWIGTRKGLYLLKGEQLTFYGAGEGLPNDAIMSLYEDAAGALWVGSYGGGLSRFKNDKFTIITVRDGLFNNIVYAIVPDDTGNLWMTCNRGVFRVAKASLDEFMDGSRKTVESDVYGTADGMKTFDVNGGFQPAALKASDGKLWFPTGKGAAVIDPNRIQRNLLPPPVYLENLIADGEAMPLGGETKIPAGTRRLEFEFAGLSYVAPEKVRFRYRLEGYDVDWIDAGNQREAFYTNLSSGDYVFHVAAANNDDIWNETGAKFAFRINPFFYQTWWFVLLCVLAAGGFLAAMHFQRVRLMRLRHAAVLEERTRIARELHDTLLQGFVGVSSQLSAVAAQFQPAPEIAERHLDVARKMIRHSVTEARRAVQNLRSDERAEADFNRTLRRTVERVAEGQSLEINFEIVGAAFEIAPEIKQQILRIAEEATLNAVKHAAAVRAEIVISYNAPAVRLEVADDGRGFDLKNTFSTLNGHFGLLGMKERAEQVGGKLHVESVTTGGTKIVFESQSAAAKKNGTAKRFTPTNGDAARK